MTLLQNNKGKWVFKTLICSTLLLIGIIYYSHIINKNSAIGIASEDLVFGLTSCFFGIMLVMLVAYFAKEYYNEKQREKISENFGWTAIITLIGGLFFYAVFGIKTPATWLSDLFIQTIAVTVIGCIAIMPKKGNYTLPASMIFPLMAIVVYLCYRF